MKTLLKEPLLRILCLMGSSLEYLSRKQFHEDLVNKILIFQLGGIGDVLRIFPAIKALREKFPEAAISTLTEFGDELFDLFPSPQIIFKKYRYDPKGKHRSMLNKFHFFRSLKYENFDLVYNPNRGNVIVEASIMAFLTGAPHRLGFEKGGAGFLNTIRREFRYDQYILKQNLDLLREIDISVENPDIPIGIPEGDRIFIDTFFEDHAISREKLIITMHPGAKHDGSYRMWPQQKYSELIKYLVSYYKATVILIGSKAEIPIASGISSNIENRNLINAAGQTTITQMAALIKNSNIFIGNDSGPLHIAIALKAPSIGIFGYTSPRQVIDMDGSCIALYKKTSDNIYLHQPFYKFRPAGENPIDQIEVRDVLEAVRTLLSRSHPLKDS